MLFTKPCWPVALACSVVLLSGPRILEKATKPAPDSRPLWRRMLSRPRPSAGPPAGEVAASPGIAVPGSGIGSSGRRGILGRIFGRRTAEAQWTSDTASLGGLAGNALASGAAGGVCLRQHVCVLPGVCVQGGRA